jgi:hypothetical protein
MKKTDFLIENSTKPFHTEVMLEGKDLRVGNYVLVYGTDVFKCAGIDERMFYTYRDDGQREGYSLAAVSPIPLTTEILEKCGFERDTVTKTEVYRFPKLSLMRGLDNEYRFFDIKSAPIKYLHQLQNLYFALTGEELTINL